MAIVCPVCGRLLKNERHLHAEDPATIHGPVVRPVEVEHPDGTVETKLTQEPGREDGDNEEA